MVLNIIKNELTVIRDKFDDERRTQIELDFEEISYEDTLKIKVDNDKITLRICKINGA